MNPTVSHWSTLADGEALAATYVSGMVGIVSRTFARVHELDDAYCYSIGSEACRAERVLGTAVNKYNGGGNADEVATYLAAVGETVERYSGAFVPHHELREGSFAALTQAGLTCLRPEEFTFFHSRQYQAPGFPFHRPTESTVLTWRECIEAGSGSLVWVPSQLLFLGDTRDHGAARIGYATSSGLAHHCSPHESMLRGAFELIERDAFIQTWYNQLSLPLVDVSSHADLHRFIQRHCTPSGVDVELVDLSGIAKIPTVLAVSRNRQTDLAPVALGAASGPSMLKVCCSAAIESLQTRNWVKAQQRTGMAIDIEVADFATEIVDFEDHISLYASPGAATLTEFLTASSSRIQVDDREELPTDTPVNQWNCLVDRMKAQHVRLFTTSMTSPDVAEAGGSVYRVFSPDLHPLDVGFVRRYLGGSRLREHAWELGLRTGPLEYDEVYPYPHPFP